MGQDKTIQDDAICCACCGREVPWEELWRGGACEGCAVARDPCACPACKATGVVWQPGWDEKGNRLRRLMPCDDCGGEG